MNNGFASYSLDIATPTDTGLQAQLERIDAEVRRRHGLASDQTDVGLLDLRTCRLAMIHPDRIEYAASVPKIGILLAWFQRHPEAARDIDPTTRHELGLMIKVSSNEMASKYSHAIGLAAIRQVLDRYAFYDSGHGGGLWIGKHYGKDGERVGDPLADHSHAATVRQLLRFYLLLEQGKLVSPAASQAMRAVFASPEIPHQQNKFVLGLAGRPVEILRKSGSWEDWLHDTALVSGSGRHYILVALTRHPKGDSYLADLARAVDDALLEGRLGTARQP
jgi:beta-lactamase class A